ncbi:TetR family transcriptional regulator [Ktedonobacter sp. SOSP1-85]|uniref:TetR/AcrR family transcriptional regulator n=1 Tax=Ktedonobacter sp. SOSP1-85 TaxID=2778367 RepID=UPI0019166D68|nr:TetR/AcrR family transcriptional regulator [Ktedonobacter sp. SOSP1-85]GHO79047.1 TetR family transcriptional regulator [Ktedonobacter sp. SOSP1-85]
MPSLDEKEQERGEERSRRHARADRILDAAKELLQRWGYKKTTIDDIAKQANVAKGTIYLHWKTREVLFEALLVREWLSVLADLRQRLASDPTGVMLSSLTRHLVLIAVDNSLFRAVLLRDTETLGDLIHSGAGQNLVQIRLGTSMPYLELLYDNGLLRSDIDMETQIKMISAINIGFFVADRFLPPGSRLAPEELAEALALTLHRTFEPEEPPAPEALDKAMQIFNQLLDQFANAIARQYKEIE